MHNGTPCITTVGAVDRAGYRVVHTRRFGVNVYRRHRLAWIDHHGCLPPADTPLILHHCDNPPCENAEHLYAGTVQDNQRDMRSRRRDSSPPVHAQDGERNNGAKLTWTAVRTIRAEHAAGVTMTALATRYGVCRTNVSRIVNGHGWRESAA